jgi:hypothetical protein
MNWYDSLLVFLQTHEAIVLLALSALVLCLLLCNLYLVIKLGRLSRGSKAAAAVVAEPPASQGLDLRRRLGRSEEEIVLLGERQSVFEDILSSTVQKVGLVRFDAFPDIGGEQSFALALLDKDMNGVVLSSLFGRTDSRVYAKEVAEGSSRHSLSSEEKEAIRRAMGSAS